MLPVLIAVFALYVAVVTFQMRQAVAATEQRERQRQAVRLLLLVSAGVPLAAALIVVAI
ncbi:MAG: hypothetical protein QF664_13005 [Dehalococcoidia bacterium]|jgi:hypothetical protein|nr:hypothetical protein [Dehalococcoidia bacterium]